MLPQLYSFKDLKERGIVHSWAMLKELIERHGFPVILNGSGRGHVMADLLPANQMRPR